MQKYNIIFYEKEDGSKPVEEFLDSLDAKMRAKMIREIGLLKDNGPSLRKPHSESLDDGIFELRAKVSSDISRVLYFFRCGKKIILTNGFIKKTQKTPKPEIELAQKYRADYIARNGGD